MHLYRASVRSAPTLLHVPRSYQLSLKHSCLCGLGACRFVSHIPSRQLTFTTASRFTPRDPHQGWGTRYQYCFQYTVPQPCWAVMGKYLPAATLLTLFGLAPVAVGGEPLCAPSTPFLPHGLMIISRGFAGNHSLPFKLYVHMLRLGHAAPLSGFSA